MLASDPRGVPDIFRCPQEPNQTVFAVGILLDLVEMALNTKLLDVAFVRFPKRILFAVGEHPGNFDSELCQAIPLEEIFRDLRPWRRARWRVNMLTKAL